MAVSLVKFDESLDSIKKAIELCNGFEKLNSSDKVLIKPNNCARNKVQPPYGMITTTKIIEGVIQLLLEYGCTDISIGEGPVIGIIDEFKFLEKRNSEWSGIDKVAKKNGVKLINFNNGPFQELNLGGIKIQVAKAALEPDFLINIPVLKTHYQAKVSLGFKNLKGCLSQTSKKRFHNSKRLDNLISLLNEAIKSDLTIIDGIYMLENGPETFYGTAYRKDLIIASPDIFECDIIGSTILGIDPSQVVYLKEFAERHNRSFDISTIQIKGEDIKPLKEHLEWQFVPIDELLTPTGATGLVAAPPGQTLCSGCAALLTMALFAITQDNPGMDFGGAEVCYGQEVKPSGNTQKVFLYGNCAIRTNKDFQNATRVKGCPPRLLSTLRVFMNAFLSKPKIARTILLRTIKQCGMGLGIYTESFPKWERYSSKEFDKTHFWPST